MSSRKIERERRRERAITEVMLGVLTNWGIEIEEDDPTPWRNQFAEQVGHGESVDYHEILDVIQEIARECFTLGAVGIPTEIQTSKDADEVRRLRSIIALAYSHHSWDIGILKNVLARGLEGPRDSHAHVHQWGPPIGKPRATTCVGCGHTRAVNEGES